MKQRISIIIPAYNEERYLSACLDSIAAQTVKPFEVIVVDNNSSDNTAAIAMRYPFVTLLHEKEQGIIPARNRGFRAAQGDIIGRVDGDSVLPPTWVASVLENFSTSANGCIGVTGSLYFVDAPFRRLSTLMHGLSYFGVAWLVYRKQVFYGGSMAFRASALPLVWERAHVSGAIHEDVDLALVMAPLGRVQYDSSLIVGVSIMGTVTGPGKMLRYLWMLVSFWRYRPASSSRSNSS